MSIRAGQILHVGNSFVFDRVQTAGVTNINIPETRIWELGDFTSVTTLRDIPDLTFQVDSFDATIDLEAITTGVTPSSVTAGPGGTELDFLDAMPIDIISPFRSANNAFDIVKGIAAPYLTLETASYKFGVRAESTKTFSYKGDSLYYIPGQPYYEEFNITAGSPTYTLAHSAINYVEQGVVNHVLCATAVNPTTKIYKRLFNVVDYDDSATTIHPNGGAGGGGLSLAAAGYTKLHVVYGSTTLGSYAAGVNATVATKPGAVRGKDVCVYISDNAASPTLVRWTGVQSVQIDRKVNLQATQELCNPRNVAYDYDQAEVTGNVVFRPLDPTDLQAKIAQILNVSTSVVAGPYSSVGIPIEVRVNNPDTGATIETLYSPDARFTIPAFSGRINQRAEITFPFASDTGNLFAYNGRR